MRFFLLFALCILLGITTSCSNNSPEDVAKNYIESIAHGNIEKAKNYATHASADLLDFTKNFPIQKNENYKFVLVKDSIKNDTAWIRYKTQHGEEDLLTLIKEDEKWKVSLGD